MVNLLVSGSHSLHESVNILVDFKMPSGEAYFPYQIGSYGEILDIFDQYDWFEDFKSDLTQGYPWLMQKKLGQRLRELLLQPQAQASKQGFFAATTGEQNDKRLIAQSDGGSLVAKNSM